MHFYNTEFIFSRYLVSWMLQSLCQYNREGRRLSKNVCLHIDGLWLWVHEHLSNNHSSHWISGVQPQQSLQTALHTHYLCSTPQLVSLTASQICHSLSSRCTSLLKVSQTCSKLWYIIQERCDDENWPKSQETWFLYMMLQGGHFMINNMRKLS